MKKIIPVLVFALCIPAFAKEAMLMNRLGPTQSELYIANADGSGNHKLLPTSGGMDYHANFSADGKWVVFTSERNGLGQSDIYRVRVDGTGLERLTDSPAVDDQASFSPDGNQIAFVSDRDTWRANIWILDLKTKKLRNLTGAKDIQGDPMKPDGFYRPQWSPDGNWIVFSSDRNTDWKAHDDNVGWEHLQELSIYIVHPDGTGFKRLTGAGIDSTSPRFSPDGKKIIYAEMPVGVSWLSRVDQLSKLPMAASQIISINLETGKRDSYTTGPGLKLAPQMFPDGNIGYTTKIAQDSGIAYVKGGAANFPKMLRSPAWSADGKLVVYELINNKPHPQHTPLYSWDPKYDYFYADVFPTFTSDGYLVETSKDTDSSLIISKVDGTDRRVIFKSETYCKSNDNGPCGDMTGVALQPTVSPDGQWIIFSFGGYWRTRDTTVAKLMMIKRDGTGLTEITSGTPNTGFASFSPDGKEIVFRSWGPNEDGLRIMNLATKKVRVLTDQLDNVPGWSVKNQIVFTRKSADNNFDIYTINPDGTNLKRLTTHPSSDAHAVWSYDGTRIMWDASQYGFKDEAELYDNSFQPYGQLWVMNADGSDPRPITDSHWEDSMAAYVPPNAK